MGLDALVTVVIPTHNRPRKLVALLESLERHQVPELDSVVVVDDSDEPADLRRFESLHLEHVVLGRRVFISKAKNMGWQRTKTEFVYFIDDDNVVDNTTIGPLVNRIRASPTVAAMMPSVLYKSTPSTVWVYATPLLPGRLKHLLVGRNLPRNASLENRLLSTDALPNAFIIRRRALEDVGGFDENLVVNSSMDLCLRLKAKRWGVFAYSGSLTYHDVELPGKFGWWAAHGSADPERVRYEIRDWFIIRRKLLGEQRFFALRSVFESAKFVIPNLLAYATRGRKKGAILRSLSLGYLEGLRSKSSTPSRVQIRQRS